MAATGQCRRLAKNSAVKLIGARKRTERCWWDLKMVSWSVISFGTDHFAQFHARWCAGQIADRWKVGRFFRFVRGRRIALESLLRTSSTASRDCVPEELR